MGQARSVIIFIGYIFYL